MDAQCTVVDRTMTKKALILLASTATLALMEEVDLTD